MHGEKSKHGRRQQTDNRAKLCTHRSPAKFTSQKSEVCCLRTCGSGVLWQPLSRCHVCCPQKTKGAPKSSWFSRMCVQLRVILFCFFFFWGGGARACMSKEQGRVIHAKGHGLRQTEESRPCCAQLGSHPLEFLQEFHAPLRQVELAVLRVAVFWTVFGLCSTCMSATGWSDNRLEFGCAMLCFVLDVNRGVVVVGWELMKPSCVWRLFDL